MSSTWGYDHCGQQSVWVHHRGGRWADDFGFKSFFLILDSKSNWRFCYCYYHSILVLHFFRCQSQPSSNLFFTPQVVVSNDESDQANVTWTSNTTEQNIWGTICRGWCMFSAMSFMLQVAWNRDLPWIFDGHVVQDTGNKRFCQADVVLFGFTCFFFSQFSKVLTNMRLLSIWVQFVYPV